MAAASLFVLGGLSLAVGGPSWPQLLAIAAAATLLEQLAVGGIDNLTVPLGVAWLWQRCSGLG
jgi:phytol kinase